MTSVNLQRIVDIARNDMDEAINILGQDKKAGLREVYLGINEARRDNNPKLYH